LENVEWSTYNRPGVFAKLQEYVPDLKGVLDIKQARISSFGYQPYLEEMGDRIATVHLSDIREDGKMCLPGRGVFDFEELIKRLRNAGCQAPLLIEAYKDDYNDVEELQKSCEFLQEILYKIG
jgi:sugar phosphate isomerase/epimerase